LKNLHENPPQLTKKGTLLDILSTMKETEFRSLQVAFTEVTSFDMRSLSSVTMLIVAISTFGKGKYEEYAVNISHNEQVFSDTGLSL
jgi:hypothetical protein